jgi:hypothetical protein
MISYVVRRRFVELAQAESGQGVIRRMYDGGHW